MARTEEVRVPDIGDFDAVDVVEVLVSPGDTVEAEDSLISLESEKATMDVPSPRAGKVVEVKVERGDKVSAGDPIVVLEVADEEEKREAPGEKVAPEPADERRATTEDRPQREPERSPEGQERERGKEPEGEREGRRAKPPGRERERGGPRRLEERIDEESFAKAYASPAVRRFARELGVDLGNVEGSGRKGRILKEDVQEYVKRRLAAAPAATPGVTLPEPPAVDFAQFGEVERRPLTRIQRIAAPRLQRAWVTIPHVTQFDEADITDLEAFRKEHVEEARSRGVKLTLLSLVMKACVPALRKYPTVNSSLDTRAEELVVKEYIHMGFAVDTEEGLLVPVIRDVDRKGIYDLAGELTELSERARKGKLKPEEMRGGSFTISSLGGLGGTAFTPIVNAPEAAILGVSRASWKPVWRDGEFEPRLMLPLSFSYDHRVIDGALAVRFTTYLASVLSDLREVLL